MKRRVVEAFLIGLILAGANAIESGAYRGPSYSSPVPGPQSFQSQRLFYSSPSVFSGSSDGYSGSSSSSSFQQGSGYSSYGVSEPKPDVSYSPSILLSQEGFVSSPSYLQQSGNDNSIGGLTSAYGFTTEQPICPVPYQGPCKDSKYRTIDGSCNNLRNPAWGTPNTRYGRLLPQKYADGLHQPAVSVTGKPLPSSRLVSIVLFPELPVEDPVWTLITMQWGQIITHDMSMAMGTTQAKPLSNQCCSSDGRLALPNELAAPSCFPITIPPDDPVYSKYNQQCMNFMRSTTDVDMGCASPHKPQEQIVTVTHWMDASFVYGQNEDKANSLREGAGGRLLVEFRGHRAWPPSADNKTATCDAQYDTESCYRFGDVRGNQNPQLTVLQILFLREHNRLANALAHLNPHWDDETLYQEARRILIAEYQHINYHEWLPILLDTKNMMQRGLLYKTDSYIDDYREDIQPNTLNDHATSAFRYFHTAIQGKLQMLNEHRAAFGALRLSDFFNRPGVIEEGDNMDSLTRGMATQGEEEVDAFLTSEVTDYLFRNRKPFGRDLRAIDIQRGRDHGLASYNDYRHYCGLPKARKFEDFGDFISQENIEKLSLLYATPDDVDFIVGGSLEAHVKETLNGPTFLCVLMEQFYRTRVSDRYFYEQGHSTGAFTPEQLREIRKATVSRFMCDNSDHIEVMQPEGFRVVSEKNPLVPCHDINALPAIDLRYWKEEVYSPAHSQYGKK